MNLNLPYLKFCQNEERFGRAVQILATWLERGDCSKRNSNGFYSMIQSAHAHLRRLGAEKSQLEEEAKRTHETLRQKFLHLTAQCELLLITISVAVGC